MVLRAVLSAQAGKVSQALGVRSGVEMRAARRSAERIGAQIVLGECALVNRSLARASSIPGAKQLASLRPSR